MLSAHQKRPYAGTFWFFASCPALDLGERGRHFSVAHGKLTRPVYEYPVNLPGTEGAYWKPVTTADGQAGYTAIHNPSLLDLAQGVWNDPARGLDHGAAYVTDHVTETWETYKTEVRTDAREVISTVERGDFPGYLKEVSDLAATASGLKALSNTETGRAALVIASAAIATSGASLPAAAGGALLGVALDYGSQVVRNLRTNGARWQDFVNVDARSFGRSAWRGAAAGSIVGLTNPFLPVGGSSLTGFAATASGEVLQGMGIQAATNYVGGRPLAVE